MNFLTAAGRITLLALLVYAVFLVTLATSQSPEVFRPLFSESGPFEQMSVLLWALLGVALLLPGALPNRPRLAMAVVALLFAAREADLHKRFTVMSLEKIKFYLSPDVPMLQKLLGGLVWLMTVALLVYLGRALYGAVRRQQLLHSGPGQVMMLAVLMLPLSKVIDRFSSQLYEMFQIVLPPLVQRLIAAFEEGMEMIMPLLFLVAWQLYRAQRPAAQQARPVQAAAGLLRSSPGPTP